MKILPSGIAVLEPTLDSLLSRWVERDGDLTKYDPRIRDVFLPLIPEGGTVIDGGACIGDHSVAYAEKVGPAGRVFAFEPYPNALVCLQLNTSRLPQVVALPLALDDAFRQRELRVNAHNAGMTRMAQTGAYGFSCVPLDCFHFERVDFIKLDLEGMELAALRGAQRILQKHRPVVVVETGSQLRRYGTTHDELVAFMASRGYHCEALPEERPGDSVYDVLFRPQ